jgi:hypothetical protein
MFVMRSTAIAGPFTCAQRVRVVTATPVFNSEQPSIAFMGTIDGPHSHAHTWSQ